MPKSARELLGWAATVDDIGSFVNQARRYEQSADFIEANELIGMSDREMKSSVRFVVIRLSMMEMVLRQTLVDTTTVTWIQMFN